MAIGRRGRFSEAASVSFPFEVSVRINFGAKLIAVMLMSLMLLLLLLLLVLILIPRAGERHRAAYEHRSVRKGSVSKEP